MTNFIDFDRTIFDTPAFKKMLTEEFSIKDIPEDLRKIFSKKEDEKVEEVVKQHGLMHTAATFFATGRSGFAPDELSHYLYPEVPEFLKAHGSNTMIVTYGVEAFITAKVSSALAEFSLKRIVYTVEEKGHVMSELTKEIPGPWRFIDDAIFQLESVAKMCPDVEIFEMRRDGAAGDGRWPVIHSLDELP
jgi:hypothetical protein